jgi:hypothetical protein
MKTVQLFLLAALMIAPLAVCAQDTGKVVDFGLDTPAKSKEFLPDNSKLGLSEPAFENTKAIKENEFGFSGTEIESSREEREYQQALTAIEEERKAVKHRQEVAAQSRAFSKEFLAMNLYGSDFPKRFAEIMEKYPLAAEEEFCGRLIERGRRILAAAEAKLASAGEATAEKKDPAPQAEVNP